MVKPIQKMYGCNMAIACQPGDRQKVTDSASNGEFPYFALLPAEAREIIWAAAIENDHKIIEMKHKSCYRLRGQIELSQKEHYNNRQFFKTNKSDHSGLLGACYESREMMLPTLQELRLGQGQKVLFNPLKDAIYFGPSSYIPYWEHIDRRPASGAVSQRPAYNCWPSKWIALSRNLSDDNIETGIHPLLCKRGLADQRDKIINLAIDADFWRLSQDIGTTRIIISNFQSVKTVVLSVGDMGEKRVKPDPGQDQFLTLKERQNADDNETRAIKNFERTTPLWSVCWGEVTFSNDADDMGGKLLRGWATCPLMIKCGTGASFKWVTIKGRLGMINFSTQCARRGGIYCGHSNRTKTGAAKSHELISAARELRFQPGGSLLTRY